MGWCFAKVNGRLAEIYFEEVEGELVFFGHAYVKESDYKTKKEINWIKRDTEKYSYLYRNHKYKDYSSGRIFKLADLSGLQ